MPDKKQRPPVGGARPGRLPPPPGSSSTGVGKAPPDDEPIVDVGTPASEPSFTTVLRRREDFLNLEFHFYNLVLDATKANLIRPEPGSAWVVINLPPQAIAEQALYQRDTDTEPAKGVAKRENLPLPDEDPLLTPPLGARLAGGSWIAFRVPSSVTAIPYTTEGLLDWGGWDPVVVPMAHAPEEPHPGSPAAHFRVLREPKSWETSLELPWWLILSPSPQGRWVHASQPIAADEFAELWHTRLGHALRGDVVSEAADKTVRAVWARDPLFELAVENAHEPTDGEDIGVPGMPFRSSLSPLDRRDLVVSTADWQHVVTPSTYVPEPIEVERLMLSSLGGWLDARGSWEGQGDAVSLASWRHIAGMGRDHYVRVVRRGYCCPFRHGMALIKITERKFATLPGLDDDEPAQGRRVAYDFQRYIPVFSQLTMKYGGPGHPDDGRGFPFTEVRVKSLILPNIDKPAGDDTDQPGLGNTRAFVAKVDEQPLLVHMVGTDHAGRSQDFLTPIVFVDETVAANDTKTGKLLNWYNDPDTKPKFRSAQLNGQAVAVAEPDSIGDTDLEIHTLNWGAAKPDTPSVPPFFPTMASAEIRLAAAEAVLGAKVGGNQLPVVVYNDEYKEDGFRDDAPGEVFVQLRKDGTPVDLDFAKNQAGDRSGGVITPNIGITALSRKKGPVGGKPNDIQGGKFDPKSFFPATAKLLGDILLSNVIDDAVDFDSDRVISFTSGDPDGPLVVGMVWKPKVKSFPDGDQQLFIASNGGNDATLELKASVVAPEPGASGSPTVRVVGDLRNFQVSLLQSAPFIVVSFDRFRFQSETGKKTDVDCVIHEVLFQGPLEFVNQLKDFLSFSAGGFSIELKPMYLDAGFQLPIPSITVGVFALQNIAFVAGTTIPFTGDPIRFRFGFSTRDDPFLISVLIFGGGGFFELAIGPDGVESFQAALEFGVMAAINLVVAAGSLSITAGIYLAIGIETDANPDGAVELTGFIRLKGEVEVMGLISLAILMEAAFTYIPDTKKAIVRATIVVEVEVLVFSGEVEIEYEKRFGGSGDPSFGDGLLPDDWQVYANAFAEIGA